MKPDTMGIVGGMDAMAMITGKVTRNVLGRRETRIVGYSQKGQWSVLYSDWQGHAMLCTCTAQHPSQLYCKIHCDGNWWVEVMHGGINQWVQQYVTAL